MPHKCCVATCRGNYKTGPKVAVFSFPKDPELKERWIWNLKREDTFQPTKFSKVCELHFQQDEILREVEMFDEKNAKVIKAPLVHPRLKPNAIPSQFPNGPSYLTTTSSIRESPRKKRGRLEIEHINKAVDSSIKAKEQYDALHTFKNLEQLQKCLERKKLSSHWTVVRSADYTAFLNISFTPAPEIRTSLTINSELYVTVFVKKVKIKTMGNFLIPSNISNINNLLDLIKKLEVMCESAPSDHDVMESLSFCTELLTYIKVQLPEKEQAIDFIVDQLTKLHIEKHCIRYSAEYMIFWTLLYTISPSAFKFLRNSGNITIPHPRSVQRLCSGLYSDQLSCCTGDFLEYIRQKYPGLQEKDKTIILMMDEIHLKPCFDFKGGNLCGNAFNSESAATSAYVFMIRSLLSSFEDVVHILPVRTLNAEDLYSYVNKIVIGLEEIGFKTIAVVSDNNAINKKTMSLFSTPPKNLIVYKHPVDPSRPLFFLIDSVHILKCIRNNWINQKNKDQCFYYPDFNDFSITHSASFKTLRDLHKFESGNLLKFGYGLTLKALYPTNLERQNVKLALQIFDERVAEGLLIIGEENNLLHYKETSDFIKIICKWWSIVNVKTIFKGIHKRDRFQEPLTTSADDLKLQYLEKMMNWLDMWKKIEKPTGKLTKETHFALYHTIYGLIELTRYCINELNFQYLLPGKVQTDVLENRFGAYRQFSGSVHNISIRQVYETENKLRLHNFLPSIIKSSKYGNIPIQLNINDIELEQLSNSGRDAEMFIDKIFIDEADTLEIVKEIPLLTYCRLLLLWCLQKTEMHYL